MDSIIVNLSIENNLYFKSVINDINFNLISNDYLKLIEKNKSSNQKSKTKINLELDEIIKNIQNYYKFKSSNFQIFKIKNIYDLDSVIEINKYGIRYEKIFLVKLSGNDLSNFYLICFNKKDKFKDLKIYNNIENIRNFIYLVLTEL